MYQLNELRVSQQTNILKTNLLFSMISENSGREQSRLFFVLAGQKCQLAPLFHSRLI